MIAKTLLTLGLAAAASAHVVISNPVPYGRSSLSNGPLQADGSDFPCKQRAGVYDLEGASNVYALGSTGNPLNFVGSAVHGGGSCQIVMTYDAKPDKNSVWKVITSIEGGCPAQGQTGNMGDNAAFKVPFDYSFNVPSNIPAGNGTIAWVWFNKIGNREMYMNCGPLTLTGAGGDQSNFDALPNMFKANIGKEGNDCETPEGQDVQFPNPGSVVFNFNGATSVFFKPTSPACLAGGNGDSRPAEPTQKPSPSRGGDSPAAPPTTPAPSVPGGVFIPVQPTPTPTPAPQKPKEPSNDDKKNPGNDTPAVPSPPAAAPETPTGNGGAQAVGSPCSAEGTWNCVGGKSFQRCASGSWSAVIQLAAGTSCSPGESANINMVVTRNGRKRALRYRSS